MENKNTGLIILIVVLSLLVLGLGGFILYDKVLDDKPISIINENKNTTEKTENSSNKLSDIISIATKKSNDTIIALTKDGSEIELMNTKGYTEVIYTYFDGILYLCLYSYSPGNIDVDTGETIKEFSQNYVIGYIDLSDNDLSFTELSNIEAEGSPQSIAFANNVIYFTTSSFDGIYQYNINTKKVTTSIDYGFNNGNVLLYTISKDYLGYDFIPNYGVDEESRCGIIDIKSGNIKTILSNTRLEYIYDGKIIYKKYDKPKNYSYWIYFEYNIKDEISKQISDSTNSTESSTNSYILPVKEYYIYADGNTLNRFLNGKREELYEIDMKNTGYALDTINLISENTLHITYGDGHDGIFEYANFNLDSKDFNNIKTDKSYYQAIYIK